MKNPGARTHASVLLDQARRDAGILDIALNKINDCPRVCLAAAAARQASVEVNRALGAHAFAA
ncbi:MAG TPA: hypothetical protein VGO59_14145 [Verrucomicrobiae bacterium]